MYKYLLWDIDGTVLNFKAAESAAIKKLFVQFGLGTCTDEMLSRYSAINGRWWQAMERGEVTKPQLLTGRFREFFAGEGIDPAVAEAFNEAYLPALGDYIVFCDDSCNILKQLKGRYVLAAVTNGTEIAQNKKLSASGLDKLFDAVFISGVVGYEKPDRRFFEVVFDRLGIKDPAEAIIIGDSLTSDIQGGHNMGIDTCWYAPSGRMPDHGEPPKYIIRDLHQVLDIIK